MTFINSQVKLFQHIDRLALIKGGGRPAPVNVEIDLSNRCSLGCEWCHFAYTHTRGPLKGKQEKPLAAVPGGDLMPFDLAVSIIDQLAQAGVRSVTWTGGGEPTLHPDFDEIVSYAAGKFEQGIYTHGGHISEGRAGILKASFTFVYVSLDAANAEDYKRDKGVNRFVAACDGIRRLAAAEGEATVGVGYLVTEKNWQEAGRAAHLARELGADYVQFRPTILYDQANPALLAEDTDWVFRATRFLKEVGSANQGFAELDLERFDLYRDWGGHGYKTCFWSGVQSVITPNGKVWTCANKREHPDAELGDLTVDSFADVWARNKPADVNADCRVMCRGHIANVVLDEVMSPKPHGAFI